MIGVWREWGPVIVASIIGLPLALLLAAALTRARTRRGSDAGWARRASFAEVGMVAGTLPWLWMILTPRPAPGVVELVPLRTVTDVLAGGLTTSVVQIGGNLLVFAAFGACAPLRWRIGAPAVIALAAGGSLAAELLQFTLALGRVSAVDDVLVNALGAGLAALCSRRWWLRRRRAARQPPVAMIPR